MPKKRGKRLYHPAAVVLFLLYIALLSYLLFFSETYGRTMSERDYRYNLELFKEIKRFWTNSDVLGWKTVLLNVVGNILAFMPFGFLLPMVSKIGKNFFGTLALSLCFSLVAEILQLVTRVGAFDVDDLFLNTIGGVIGFLGYCIIWKPFLKYWRKKHQKKGSKK